MGRQKALLTVKNMTLIEHHLDAFRRMCDGVIVVTGFQANRIRTFLHPDEERHNPNWAHTEMRESALIGISNLRPTDRILITPVDTIPPPYKEIGRLIESQQDSVPRYQGRIGHPCIIKQSVLKEKLQSGPLNEFTPSLFRIKCDWDCAINLNTPTDWELYFGKQARK